MSRYIKCFTFAFVIELLSVALEQQRSFRPSIHFCQSVSIALFWLLLLFKHSAISLPLPVLALTRDLCSCVRIMLCSAGSEKAACAALLALLDSAPSSLKPLLWRRGRVQKPRAHTAAAQLQVSTRSSMQQLLFGDTDAQQVNHTSDVQANRHKWVY